VAELKRSANKDDITDMKPMLPILAIAVPLFSGCGDTIDGKSIAEPEVARFHERLTARQFAEIYSSASDDLKKAASKEKLTELLAAIDRKLGRLKSSKETSWNVRTFNLRTTVVLVQESEFERGTATETSPMWSQIESLSWPATTSIRGTCW
jgi:hypothetical protein